MLQLVSEVYFTKTQKYKLLIIYKKHLFPKVFCDWYLRFGVPNKK